jgi:hypothetical protein
MVRCTVRCMGARLGARLREEGGWFGGASQAAWHLREALDDACIPHREDVDLVDGEQSYLGLGDDRDAVRRVEEHACHRQHIVSSAEARLP